MRLSLRKIDAIFWMKLQAITKNMSIMIGPIMAIGIVLLMKAVMPEVDASEGGIQFSKGPFLLSFGLLFNNVMGGMMMSSHPLAEEKEKNTLRVLMTSSVKGGEFFIGSMLPSLLILFVVNLLLIPVSGVAFSQIQLPTYLFLTTMTSLITILMGYIIGIVAKNQAQANLVGTPIMLALTMIPSFSGFHANISKISSYTYSGVLSKYTQSAFSPEKYQWNSKDLGVLFAWFVVCLGLFIYAYKKNGLDGE
ncbi:ABC transporter permease [Enterococcus sp. 669A]|uniref:ABC transporter permease n=1 Tax=Candidatus Enterococcus moelleringii TaxID=2815325 RepID=A0ABS3L9A9_9ENTE|nr:ABC transporter permease [Enterococcus sp. 669A]MBO1306224.1 ABC transporter permease [Enterococcus sp. 669A]